MLKVTVVGLRMTNCLSKKALGIRRGDLIDISTALNRSAELTAEAPAFGIG